jgi:hypothetical protein
VAGGLRWVRLSWSKRPVAKAVNWLSAFRNPRLLPMLPNGTVSDALMSAMGGKLTLFQRGNEV